jgi:hypothetical protein
MQTPPQQPFQRKQSFQEAIDAALKKKQEEKFDAKPQQNALPVQPLQQFTYEVQKPVEIKAQQPAPSYYTEQYHEPAKQQSAEVEYSFKNSKANLNYREVFKSMFAKAVETEPVEVVKTNVEPAKKSGMCNTDLTTRLFSSGYHLRTFSRANTEGYYSMNFYKSNKLRRDCFGILYFLYLVEIVCTYFLLGNTFSIAEYIGAAAIGFLVPLIAFFAYSINSDKRIRADYNFGLSFLNRSMLYLNLLVLVALLGFFGFTADITKLDTMIRPIIVPALLLLNLPLSSVIYQILYKTKRYHIS